MASTSSSKPVSPVRTPAPEPVKTSGVRNTAIPPKVAAAPTHEQIAKRAYEIHRSGSGGSQIDNWLRAERELRGR